MKKFIYIIALLFLLVACNEELQIDTKQLLTIKQELLHPKHFLSTL